MQLIELSLYNFCLYRGEQTFNLSPDRRHGKPKPIVLIGGINGGGKTSFYDAVLLALYGPRANCSKRSGQSYADFLTHCIHRGVDPADGASISLTFAYVSEGVETIYEVRRRWAVKNSFQETLEVFCDGEKNAEYSKNWSHVVEEIVPLGISQLFFFDAEKIRFLANDETTSEALSKAIKAMLGLDLAERLIADMKVVQLKLAERQVTQEEAQVLNEWKAELESVKDELKRLRQDCGGAQNNFDISAKELLAAEEAFAKFGGKHWDERKSNEAKKNQLADKQAELRGALVGLSAGALPFALVPNLLEFVKTSADEEENYQNARLANKALDSHDKELLKQFRKLSSNKKNLELLEDAQQRCREKRIAATEPEFCPSLSEQTSKSLEYLLASDLDQQTSRVKAITAELDKVGIDLDLVRRQLAATPEEAQVKEVASALKQAMRTNAEAEAELRRMEKACNEKQVERDELEKKIESNLLKSETERVRAEDAERMSQLSQRTRETMLKFLECSTTAKIDQLSRNILEAFRYLLRKESLVSSIQIDPVDFSISLFNEAGDPIPKNQLSEGEKQMFAISVLWGLGRASNRRLPAIIDTPMARLDATHRQHLLSRYFPAASHQTIILSTDTEVDEAYFDELEPHLARAYHLNFDERQQCTSVEEGYFWSSAVSH